MADVPEIPPSPDELNYEQAIEELESIIEAIEQGEVGLEESLAKYRRGASLLSRCRSILKRAEQDLEQLGADDSERDQP